MSVDQLDLFAAPATRGASRSTDPQTSRDAGRSMSGAVLGDQQMQVLGAIGVDATAYEIAECLWARGSRIQQNVVARRLTDLRENGWVRLTGETRPGSSARQQLVFAVTAAGRDVLAAREVA